MDVSSFCVCWGASSSMDKRLPHILSSQKIMYCIFTHSYIEERIGILFAVSPFMPLALIPYISGQAFEVVYIDG